MTVKKVFSLSPREILFRVRESGNEIIERLYFKSGTSPVPKKTGFASSAFFTDTFNHKEQIKSIKKHLSVREIVDDADRILKGELSFFDITTHHDFISWHSDPVHQFSWPRVFYKDALKEFRKTRIDVKFTWEINRHQYLIQLGKAYYVTKDDKYAEKAAYIVQSWIEDNPYNMGINWTSALELSIRIISWTWILFLCKPYFAGSTDLLHTILTSIYQQAVYIRNHLSIYTSPYNHLIGEAAALYITGTLFDFGGEEIKFTETGWKILSDQATKQFHPDGMSVEQAFFYHHFTLGFYIQTIILRQINNKEVPQAMMKRIENATEISKYLTMPDGTLPMIGDIDNARSVFLNHSHTWDFSGLLSLCSVIFDRAEFKSADNKVPEELFWFFDHLTIDKFEKRKTTNLIPASKSFSESGYTVIRDSWERRSSYLCFDCGEISDGLSEKKIPSAAHGHADALSVILSISGEPFLVDSGFYTYSGDIHWHRRLRQEEAHNTILIEGFRQVRFSGRMKWVEKKNPELLGFTDEKNYSQVSGNVKYNNKVKINRNIHYEKSKFWILSDCVKLDTPNRRVKSFLHFATNVTLNVQDRRGIILAELSGIQILISVFGVSSIDMFNGSEDPSRGWICRGYGYKEKARSIILTWDEKAKENNAVMVIIPVPRVDQLPAVAKDGSGGITVSGLEQNLNYRIDIKQKIYVKADEQQGNYIS